MRSVSLSIRLVLTVGRNGVAPTAVLTWLSLLNHSHNKPLFLVKCSLGECTCGNECVGVGLAKEDLQNVE